MSACPRWEPKCLPNCERLALCMPRQHVDRLSALADGKLPVTMATLRHMCGDYTPPPSPSELRSRAALQGDGTVVAEYSPGSGLQAGSSAAWGEERSQEPSMQREGSVAR